MTGLNVIDGTPSAISKWLRERKDSDENLQDWIRTLEEHYQNNDYLTLSDTDCKEIAEYLRGKK